jgi:tetratricopeptide (TPR) repeat protein
VNALRRIRLLALLVCLLCLPAAELRAQGSEESLADQIRANLEAGRLDAALDQARSAVGQYARSSELQQLLGVILFKKGLNEEARGAFRRAIACDPNLPQNYFDLALVDLAEKRYPDAASSLATYLRFDPGNAQAHLLLGRAYHNQNQTMPAIEQFKKALALQPALPLAHYHLGFAFQSLGNLPAALDEYYQEMQINPQFPEAYWLGGNIELEHGNGEAAEKLFREGIRLMPQAYQPHYGLARVYLARKQFADAEAELSTALRAKPDEVEAHYALARLYQQTGKKDAAEREFATCAALHAREQKSRSGIAGATPQP